MDIFTKRVNDYLSLMDRTKGKKEAEFFMQHLKPNCRFYIDNETFMDITKNEIIKNLDVIENAFTGGY